MGGPRGGLCGVLSRRLKSPRAMLSAALTQCAPPSLGAREIWRVRRGQGPWFGKGLEPHGVYKGCGPRRAVQFAPAGSTRYAGCSWTPEIWSRKTIAACADVRWKLEHYIIAVAPAEHSLTRATLKGQMGSWARM